MKTFEERFLSLADSDWIWMGFNWLRPAKERHLGPIYILFSSFILGLPGVLVGAGMIYFILGRVDTRVWLMLLVGVTMLEVLMHVPFAYFWNRRAARLGREEAGGS